MVQQIIGINVNRYDFFGYCLTNKDCCKKINNEGHDIDRVEKILQQLKTVDFDEIVSDGGDVLDLFSEITFATKKFIKIEGLEILRKDHKSDKCDFIIGKTIASDNMSMEEIVKTYEDVKMKLKFANLNGYEIKLITIE